MDEIVVKQEVRRVIDLARIMQGVRARRLARERAEGITRVMEGESRLVGSGVVQETVNTHIAAIGRSSAHTSAPGTPPIGLASDPRLEISI